MSPISLSLVLLGDEIKTVVATAHWGAPLEVVDLISFRIAGTYYAARKYWPQKKNRLQLKSVLMTYAVRDCDRFARTLLALHGQPRHNHVLLAH